MDGILGGDTLVTARRGQIVTAAAIGSDLRDWKALVPSKAAVNFLASPPRHTLPRVCHLLRLPLDCMAVIIEFVPIVWLVCGFMKVSLPWAKLVRSSRIWRRFDLASLIERSGVMDGCTAAQRGDFWLGQLAQGRFKGLTSMNVATSRINQRDLTRVLATSPAMESMDLSHCACFDDISCTALASSPCCMPAASGGVATLRHLRLNFCTLFNGHTLATAVAPAGCLETLEVSGCSQLRDADFHRFFECLPNLRNFRARASSMTYQAFGGRDVKLRRLESLDISMCAGATDEVLGAIGACCPAIVSLNIEGCRHVTDQGLGALSCAMSDRASNALRHLYIGGCQQVGDTGVCAVIDVCRRHLRVAALDKTRCTGRAVGELLRLPQLEQISFTQCLYVRRDIHIDGTFGRLCSSQRGKMTSATQQFCGYSVALPAARRGSTGAKRLASLNTTSL